MNLPEHFAFSQHSLGDYQDCPRRFLLRHVRQLAWPAPQAQPVQEHERRMEMGSRFHHMVHQHLLGIPEAQLTAMATDPDLALWWDHYLTARPAELPGARHPEVTLAAALAGHTLTAKLDLLVVGPDGTTILDWKTNDRLPKPAWLAERLQTRVYRLLVHRAGARFHGAVPIPPAQITFRYWYAAFPDAVLSFPYTEGAAREDEALLTGMIAEITSLPEEAFEATDDARRCRFCPYRSYCDRGVEAGPLADAPDLEAEHDLEDFSLDQIAEIEF